MAVYAWGRLACEECGHSRQRHASYRGHCAVGCPCAGFRPEEEAVEAGPEPCALCGHERHLHRDRACGECRCGQTEADLPFWERPAPES
ncbi:hypothetical protein BX285_6709 [Streptomyces sp. 1114.5]|nr:hypothetical protein BX285_6709 [Streptomyces sp. 1114.5]